MTDELKEKVQNFVDYMEAIIYDSKSSFIQMTGHREEMERYTSVLEDIINTQVYKEMKESLGNE